MDELMFKKINLCTQKTLRMDGLIDLILPQRCALCGCICDAGFCQNCSRLLPWIEHACIQCGSHLIIPQVTSTQSIAPSSSTLSSSKTRVVCGHCQLTPPPYVNSTIPFHYKPPISLQIQNLKYGGRLHLSSALGRTISARILQSEAPLPDIIIPIPLHWKKIFHRGFNQSSEIARVIGKQLGVPVSMKHLSKQVDSPSQTGLDIQMRMKNIRHTFKSEIPCTGLHIALVDDVVTTGSTVRAAAEILTDYGARRIDIWAVAKTEAV